MSGENREGAGPDFRVLGAVEVVADGAVLPGGGAKQVALLGRLLLSPGRIVSVDQLAEAIWGAALPSRPEASIRSNVSKWRKLLAASMPPDTSSILVTNTPGYRLDVVAGQVDSVRFEQGLAAGREILRAAPEKAEQILASALAEWRGEPFSGCDTAVFESTKARLQELRLTAQDLRIEALIDSGNVQLAVADLELLIAAGDLREARYALAMRALYLDGRQADALTMFQQLRSRLVESGIEPMQSTIELEQRILTQDASLTIRTAVSGKSSNAVDGLETLSGPAIPVPPGRETEAEALAATFAELQAGRSATLLLTGEPGIGKTTLARFGASTAPDGTSVAWGRCIHGGAATALGPWGQVLRDLCEGHGPEEVASWVGTSVELGQLVPTLALDSPTTRPSDDRLDMFDAVVRFLRRRVATEPVVLIFEDVHWADASTVELVSFAASALADSPVAFVVTWRDTDLAEAPVAAIQELGRVPNCRRLELPGISAKVIEGLLSDSVATAQAATIAATMYDRTNGNPLFVTELLGLLPRSSAQETATDVGGLPLTTGIQDTIRRRVETVGPNASEVLSVLAVVDDFASMDLVEKVCGEPGEIDRAEIEKVLAGAHRAGLVVEHPEVAGSLRLHHALAADTLTEDILGFQLAQIHADVGQALWEEGASSAVLAHHFAEGAPAGTGALAAAFSLEAAAAAGMLYDLPRAFALLEKGLAALRLNKPTDLGLESDILVAKSQIHKQAGDYELVHEAASAAFEAAKVKGDVPRMVAAVSSYTGRSAQGAVFDRVEWLGYWHPPAPAVEMLEFCIGKLPTDHPSLVALLPLLGSARFGPVEDIERSRGELAAAIELGRDIGSRDLLPALSVRLEFEGCYGTAESVHQVIEEMLAYAPVHGSVHDTVQAHRMGLILAIDTGSADGVRDHIAAAYATADSYDNELARLQAAWTESAWQLYRGELASAEEAIISGMTTFSRFGIAAVDAFGLQYAGLRRDQGQLAEVEELLQFKLSSYDGPAFRSSLAMAIAEQGRFDEASALIDVDLGPGFATLGEPALQFQTPACWALAASLSNHRSAAEQLFPVFDAQPPRVVSLNHGMLHFGSTSLYAGMLAITLDDLEGAERHLAAAESFERTIGAGPSLLRVLVQKRLLLDQLNQPTSDLDAEISDLAASLGMEHVVDVQKLSR